MDSQSMALKLSHKIRLITLKLVKPVTKLIKKNKVAKATAAAAPVAPSTTWAHPSTLKASTYVECHSSEQDENEMNEKLEAKLRQLIVEEYSNRPLRRPVSLRIQGHLTITPSEYHHQHEGTFWTADADICWRDSMMDNCKNMITQQKAERQAPRFSC